MTGCVLKDLGWEDATARQIVSSHPAYRSATRPLVPIKAKSETG
jgi:hypothetical protein